MDRISKSLRVTLGHRAVAKRWTQMNQYQQQLHTTPTTKVDKDTTLHYNKASKQQHVHTNDPYYYESDIPDSHKRQQQQEQQNNYSDFQEHVKLTTNQKHESIVFSSLNSNYESEQENNEDKLETDINKVKEDVIRKDKICSLMSKRDMETTFPYENNYTLDELTVKEDIDDENESLESLSIINSPESQPPFLMKRDQSTNYSTSSYSSTICERGDIDNLSIIDICANNNHEKDGNMMSKENIDIPALNLEIEENEEFEVSSVHPERRRRPNNDIEMEEIEGINGSEETVEDIKHFDQDNDEHRKIMDEFNLSLTMQKGGKPAKERNALGVLFEAELDTLPTYEEEYEEDDVEERREEESRGDQRVGKYNKGKNDRNDSVSVAKRATTGTGSTGLNKAIPKEIYIQKIEPQHSIKIYDKDRTKSSGIPATKRKGQIQEHARRDRRALNVNSYRDYSSVSSQNTRNMRVLNEIDENGADELIEELLADDSQDNKPIRIDQRQNDTLCDEKDFDNHLSKRKESHLAECLIRERPSLQHFDSADASLERERGFEKDRRINISNRSHKRPFSEDEGKEEDDCNKRFQVLHISKPYQKETHKNEREEAISNKDPSTLQNNHFSRTTDSVPSSDTNNLQLNELLNDSNSLIEGEEQELFFDSGSNLSISTNGDNLVDHDTLTTVSDIGSTTIVEKNNEKTRNSIHVNPHLSPDNLSRISLGGYLGDKKVHNPMNDIDKYSITTTTTSGYGSPRSMDAVCSSFGISDEASTFSGITACTWVNEAKNNCSNQQNEDVNRYIGCDAYEMEPQQAQHLCSLQRFDSADYCLEGDSYIRLSSSAIKAPAAQLINKQKKRFFETERTTKTCNVTDKSKKDAVASISTKSSDIESISNAANSNMIEIGLSRQVSLNTELKQINEKIHKSSPQNSSQLC